MMLLELCIAIALVALFSSILGLKTHRLLEKHAFEKGASRVQTQIIFCQKMALTHQLDMVLFLKQKKEGLSYMVYPDEESSFSKAIFGKGIIKNLELQKDLEKKESIKVIFSSTGGIFPKEPLEVVSTKHPDWKRALFPK